MTKKLHNRTAIITGGTTGIGKETAREFINEGARVLITGRSQEKIDAALADLGTSAVGVVADSSRVSDLDRVADLARERWGHVDVVFANAGNGVFSPISAVDEAAYDHQFDLNVKGVYFTVQKLLPLMREGGSIILNASAVNGKGAPGGSLYFASKAAVRSFARSLASELGPLGIRVNSLSPGIVPTQFFANSNVGEEGFGQFEEMAGLGSPLGRVGTPGEIAKGVLFLAGGDSAFATGIDLTLDGGWSQV